MRVSPANGIERRFSGSWMFKEGKAAPLGKEEQRIRWAIITEREGPELGAVCGFRIDLVGAVEKF
jgi:hypothetical protein